MQNSSSPSTDVIQSEKLLYAHELNNNIKFIVYSGEHELPFIKRLMDVDLSEPYSIYTYRYFLNQWPTLCILTVDTSKNDAIMGAIVCKADEHTNTTKQPTRMRGYIAMLAVDTQYRKRGIGSALVARAIEAMRDQKCAEVVLETEMINKGALHLYENLGFIRDKALHKYYLNQGSAYRLKLYLE
jgi:peptide alpha-N-acetyltransferase